MQMGQGQRLPRGGLELSFRTQIWDLALTGKPKYQRGKREGNYRSLYSTPADFLKSTANEAREHSILLIHKAQVFLQQIPCLGFCPTPTHKFLLGHI